ncbi:MAG TPA: alpha-amylase family glycosyl hydrolase [Thermoanaerobaculia bacterium]|nr:alpha-amylase family glycosyl hydrolase [Thermoanaerobaculia bacterium]
MSTHLWWQRGVIYQIYPRSFQDSNGDGIGDLNGIASRLDYLQWLGVDAIWLSPIFPSPMADFGYDVADYTGVEPMFGTLDDFDRLLGEAHARGLKVILDYVPNHTSEEHAWFRESRSSRDNPKRDWYLWRDPAPDGGPPNNWQSVFGGSAWELDEGTGQYYYHAFLRQQPDLNWRNPEVQNAMLDVIRFWFDRGVDGFRIDVIWHVIKDADLRDNPINPDYRPEQSPHRRFLETFNVDQPEVHGIVARMRAVSDAYPERVLIGEIYLPLERLVAYYGPNGAGVHLPYNFQLVELPWNARTIAKAVNAYEALLPSFAWPNWVLGNHDKSRIATRVGIEQARVAAMLLLTLRGTPTIYYGDELGMADVPIRPDQVRDPYEKNVPGLGLGRDPQRTPMRWTGDPKGGFTQGDPWLPVGPDVRVVNVEAERDETRSMLALYRDLIELRRREPALETGAYAPLEAAGDIVAFVRKKDARVLFVVLNLGAKTESFDLKSVDLRGVILLSTCGGRQGEPVRNSLELRPIEGIVAEAT